MHDDPQSRRPVDQAPSGSAYGSDDPTLLRLLQEAIAQSFNSVVLTDAGFGPAGPRILYANPAFCQMTGYALEELLGKTPRILQGPLTDQNVLRELGSCLSEGQHFQGSTVNYRKDGTPYTVEWHISPIRDPSGTITHFVSVQQDISALRSAQRSAQLLANALHVSQDAVFITNAEGLIEFVNQGFEMITGYSSREALGQRPAILSSGEHGPAFYRRLWHSLNAGQTFRATVTNRHKLGHLIHCEETITPVRDGQGVITHFVCIAKDMTSRIHAEQELRQQASHDSLTGLYNRRAGERELERAFAARVDDGQPLSVLLLDIDHFKAINDTWGHPAGDVALQQVAELLRTQVRSTDRVVRWGGEEFLIVLPHCPLHTAHTLAEHLRASLAATEIPEIGHLTLSIGVAEMEDQETLAGLVSRADRALYKAKKEGRNCTRLARSSTGERRKDGA
ncbi:diguanylate cyclase [Pseudomonas sp. NW5]|uniref:sensor domain-containing diguanylate cyclase n=1 Tax=Pseudomonas sp. NW5 TaxID=2934934 RepID=UPI0020217DFE|nr:diguanylate cyclase [Pseudomonas sp. NW5]MCL7462884.1 diguanylate cyclase [Pseudomonas sp. NW5]